MPDNGDNVFGVTDSTGNQGGTGDNQNKPNPSLAIPDELKELVGEGKKYADINAALASILPAQKHIETIQEENRVLREKAEKALTIEEVLQTLESNKQGNNEDNVVDPDDIAKKVIETLTNKTEAEKRRDNIQKANDELVLKYGSLEKAAEALKIKSVETEISVPRLMEIAAENPNAFLKFFNAAQSNQSSSGAPSSGSINTSSMQNGQGPEEGTYRWWQEQRKTKGDSWYNSPKMATQRLSDADRLGRDKFFS